ncbi:MAG TPA: alpha-glucan family phosphorylase [Acidimicrobiales bacterium]|nr:alpha-glucan family phosphorylase [Acidimicrobiales bacterium]
MSAASPVAYFSMEVALDDDLPTFSGGLGVLAGDVLRSAADLAEPVVAVSVCWRDGYFHQLIDDEGRQLEEPVRWCPAAVLERLEARVRVEIAGRSVVVGCWRRVLVGVTGGEVPVYFLDTDVEENSDADRAITDQLYGGDNAHRLAQEIVLGVGGPAMLDALGIAPGAFHMNEGHSSLLTLALYEEELAADGTAAPAAAQAVRARCVFTTHTPVAAGHDVFPAALVADLLGATRAAELERLGLLEGDELNMTELGMRHSHYVNGVSLRHQVVAQELAPGHRVESVTNGVHLATWAAPQFAALFDRHVPDWRVDNALLRYVGGVPTEEIAEAHREAKQALFTEVAARYGHRLDPEALTIGLARRATPYKQTTLLFSDPERLRSVAKAGGPLQVLCAGKAHPRDAEGHELIERIVAAGGLLEGDVEVHFLPDYGLEMAKRLCAGTDLWLNNPIKPYEASGTSGMKAAVNGVPSLSTLDGWWIEGCFEGVTGWAIGGLGDGDDASDLYAALEERVLPCFYGDQQCYLEVMRSSIALNASFFHTERVVREYARSAYRERGTGGRDD